jgi:hypothetical protein
MNAAGAVTSTPAAVAPRRKPRRDARNPPALAAGASFREGEEDIITLHMRCSRQERWGRGRDASTSHPDSHMTVPYRSIPNSQ